MRELTIYRSYFYDSKCYKNAPRHVPKGVQVHNTSSNPWLKRWVQPDDGLLGYNVNKNSHNNPNGTTCANAYIGKQQDGTVAVYQTLPWDQRCWLSGSGVDKNHSANKEAYIGFEIACDSDQWDRTYFTEAVMTAAVNLTAYLCQEYGIDPMGYVNDTCIGVMSHRELHNAGYASNHGDIDDWLRKFGYNMGAFRLAVIQALDQGVHVTYIDCDAKQEEQAMFDARVTPSGKYLNLRADKSTGSASLAKLTKDDIVAVLDDSDPIWWKVTHGGVTGYAMHQDTKTGAIWLQKENNGPIDSEEDEPPENEETKVLEGLIQTCEVKIDAMYRELDAIKAAIAIIREHIV